MGATGSTRGFTDEQRLAHGLISSVYTSGSDLRTDEDREVPSKNASPKGELDVSLWHWRTGLIAKWHQPEHINVLEGYAALLALKWRSRSAKRLGRVYLHFLDSMVNLGALSKDRSPSRSLNRVVRVYSAHELAMSCRGVFGCTSSARNPSDAPSRWK